MPAADKRNVALQERDVSLMKDLLESRVLSLDHVRSLYFPGKDEMARKRVQRLKAAKLLAERPRKIGEPSILHLTWNGYVALRDSGHVDDDGQLTPLAFTRRMKVSQSVLAHELSITDVRTAFTVAIQESDCFKLETFDVWPRRYEFTAQRGYERVAVKPDAYIRFIEKDGDGEFNFFLEVDMGTETQDRLVEKCVNYREHYRSGGFAEFCGGTKSEYRSYPFRVLVVCRSEARRDNLAKRLFVATPPFSTMVLIATTDECRSRPLGEIWMTAQIATDTRSAHSFLFM